MKTVLGWLGDPYLHLIALAILVMSIGSRLGAESNKSESASFIACDLCSRLHDEAKPCTRVVASGTDIAPGH